MAKILIADEIHACGTPYLKENGHEVIEKFTITPDELLHEISSYEGLIVRSRTKVTADVIAAGKRLKVIARAGSGVDNIDVSAATNRGITVVNAAGANAEAVAEHTFGLIIALARNLVPVSSALSKGQWEKKTYEAMELEGKTLGIVGLGKIGLRVARFGWAFGMNVVVHSRTTNTEEKKKDLHAIGGKFIPFDELLEVSDFVSIHVPLTPETRHLMDARAFTKMKRTAYLINTARGEVVDESALVSALTDEAIAGAGLDVFAEEPVSATNPLLAFSNVIVTPHIASMSHEGTLRISTMIAEDVVRVLKGEQPHRPV
jgi:D-3-phosphoglycerate dehydrogenase / 2-oxoglutarate reductase